jgi:hypothetical protein
MNSVRTSKRTQLVTVININLLTMLKDIIAVYTENPMELINTNAELLFVKAAGTLK